MTTEDYPDNNKELAEQNQLGEQDIADFDYDRDDHLSYIQLLEKYKAKLYHFQFVYKKEVVVRLAIQLEKEGTPKEEISARLSEDLQGYDISDRYIRDCLGEEYKQKPKQRSKFAEITSANNSKENEKPVISITSTTNGNHANYDEEMKDIYNNKPSIIDVPAEPEKIQLLGIIKDKDLEIGKLQEQLKEQGERIDELIKSVNAASEIKQANKSITPITQSLEYQKLLTEKSILDERVNELEQLLKRDIQTNPAIGFQSASNLKQNPNLESTTMSNTTTVISNTVKFPANLLGKFFIQGRNVKQCMVLNLDDKGNVESWEVQ